jgi:hypothetical protein
MNVLVLSEESVLIVNKSMLVLLRHLLAKMRELADQLETINMNVAVLMIGQEQIVK